MVKLSKVSSFVTALLVVVLVGVAAQPLTSYAKGTAEVEAVILKDKVVPAEEITRIGNDTAACSPDVGGGGSFICEETYPAGTRVTMTGSKAGWVITIRGKDNKIITQETDTGGTGVVVNADGQQTTTRDSTTGTGSGKCGMLHLDQCIMNLPGLLFAGLAFLLLTLSSIVLGIAGVVFNWVVIRTVFQFAIYFGTSPGMIVAWGVLRDIANIALLFAFIFMGIATILNTQATEGFTAKKALPSLIIFAVLLNFSLFATQGIIDVSNGLSSVFSSYAGADCATTNAGTSQTDASCVNIGISSKILEAAGMHQIIPSGDQAIGALSKAWEQPYTYSTMLIMLSLMVTVTAVVLIAATIMLVIRVVVLSFLMVTSPIGFAGMAIPGLHKIAHDWWHKLINQAFFAPVYLLMIFISLKLVDTLQDGQATISDAILGNTAAAGASMAGNMQMVMVFMIVIGFMVAALMVAQKMGAYGASFATKTAGGIAFGAQGFVARRTVGRLSAHVATSIRKSDLGETNLGRFAAGVADRGANASFSSRNLVGGMLKGTGVDFGSANKSVGHGYHGIETEAEKARMEYAKSLKGNRDESQSEAAARLQTEREAASLAAHDSVRTEADAMNAVVNAQAAEVTATTARDTQRTHRDNAMLSLGDQRAIVAANPRDAAAQVELSRLETQLARETQDLAQAEQALTQASANLASARTAETNATNARTAAETADAAARAARPERRRVDHDGNGGIGSRERQLNFARSIQHEGDPITGLGLTAATHANHAAAVAIIQNAGRDAYTRAADLMREAATAAAPAAAPAAAAPAAGGAAPAAAHGHP